MDSAVPDARQVKIAPFFKDPASRGWCFYLYDFGDCEESFKRRLLGGEWRFPPEDCGSYGGYERCVRVARGEESGMDELDDVDLKRWMGDWDPERFDLEPAKKGFDR